MMWLVIVVCLIAATPTVVVAAEETEADAVHTQAGELEETLQAAVGALKNARFNDSVVLLEDIVAGPPSQVKPTAMYLTATALQNLGREEDSLAMHLRAAAEFESFFEGANSRDAAICYEMASQCLARLGRWKEAEETIKKSMALLEAMGAGTNMELLAAPTTLLADIIVTVARLEATPDAEREALLGKAAQLLDGVLERLNDTSPELPVTLVRIGMLQAERGERDVALQTFARALELGEHSLADDQYGLLLQSMATVQMDTGAMVDAAKAVTRILEVFESVPDTPERPHQPWHRELLTNAHRMMAAIPEEARAAAAEEAAAAQAEAVAAESAVRQEYAVDESTEEPAKEEL